MRRCENDGKEDISADRFLIFIWGLITLLPALYNNAQLVKTTAVITKVGETKNDHLPEITARYIANGTAREISKIDYFNYPPFGKNETGYTFDIYYNKNYPYKYELYKYDTTLGMVITGLGIVIFVLCRKALKGYFKDFLLEHKLLLLFTVVHICNFLYLIYNIALDSWGFVMPLCAEYVLVPGNIIGLVIAALNDPY